MAGSKGLLSIFTPSGWGDVIVRSLVVAVIGFVVLQLEEYFQVGEFDTPASAVDAVLIAAGVFVLNAILTAIKS